MTKRWTFALVLAGCAISFGAAHAMPIVTPYSPNKALPSAPSLEDGEALIAPIAGVRFCLEYRDQCEATDRGQRVTLTANLWQKLQTTNRLVNSRIVPDRTKHAFHWSLEARRGNCNDYAVQKRQELLALGLPISALSLTVVRTSWGEGHLVLTVRTDRGEFVLDNLSNEVKPWNKTGHRFLSWQSAEDPQNWVSVRRAPETARILEARAATATRRPRATRQQEAGRARMLANAQFELRTQLSGFQKPLVMYGTMEGSPQPHTSRLVTFPEYWPLTWSIPTALVRGAQPSAWPTGIEAVSAPTNSAESALVEREDILIARAPDAPHAQSWGLVTR